MSWVSKAIALLAATLVAGNAQCFTACAFEHCRPAAAPRPHCHQKKTPGKGQSTEVACSHDISIIDTSAKTIEIIPAQAFAESLVAPLAVKVRQPSSHTRIDVNISPPVPELSSISVLRI